MDGLRFPLCIATSPSAETFFRSVTFLELNSVDLRSFLRRKCCYLVDYLLNSPLWLCHQIDCRRLVSILSYRLTLRLPGCIHFFGSILHHHDHSKMPSPNLVVGRSSEKDVGLPSSQEHSKTILARDSGFGNNGNHYNQGISPGKDESGSGTPNQRSSCAESIQFSTENHTVRYLAVINFLYRSRRVSDPGRQ